MNRWLGVSIFFLLCSIQAKAIDAVISHSQFYTKDLAGKLVPETEIYWQVNQRSIHYNSNAEKMIVARIRTNVTLFSDTGIITQDEFILQTVPRANASELTRNNIIDLRRYKTPNGMIRLKFTLTDMGDSTNKFVFSDSFMVYPHTNEAFYSDIQFLDTTIESDAETAFKKNGHQQIPNCSNFIDEHRKTLHYYAELYGIQDLAKDELPLIQKTYIARKENESPYDNILKRDTIVTAKNLSIDSGSFSIAAQPSGNYYVVITLENSTHQIIASANMFFQRLNPHPAPAAPEVVAKIAVAKNDTGIEDIKVLNLNKTFLKSYDLGQLKLILKMLLPFSDFNGTRTINGFLKKPDDMYMRYYIYNYFANINPDKPAAAWKEFSESILQVNKLFSQHGTPGYQTERGFIYLRYGAPTEVVTVENEQGALPYEIWQYNTLMQMNKKSIANAVFLFYKPNEVTSDYKLLHSNVTGELQNMGWRSYLYTNSSGGTNGNSRAEQYIQK